MKVPNRYLSFISDFYGSETANRLVTSLENDPSPTSFRLNPLKATKESLPQEWTTDAIAWSAGLGYYLSTRPVFTFDPLFHAGCYYVQEASSMYLAHALTHVLPQLTDSNHPLRVLDLCAAPGGKSTLLRSLLPHTALLLSNEPIKQRASVLKENITKWGHPFTAVSSGYACDIASTGCQFDLIVTDVPCSGEGMMRKEPDAVTQWSEELVNKCANLQRDIVRDIWSSLRPGGYMIYSTCTFNSREDEDNIHYFIAELGAQYIELSPPESWQIYTAGAASGYHFLPHLTRGEGFYLAVLRKPMDESNTEHKQKKNKKHKETMLPTRNIVSQLSPWLQDSYAHIDGVACPWKYIWREKLDEYAAIPSIHADFLSQLHQGHVNILQEGIPLARVKGRKLQPHPALALSAALCPNAFPKIEVSLETALAYLRTEALTLPSDTPKGYVIITYKNINLGYVNNLGNRANNLYPSEWRIRTTHLPNQNGG